MALFFKIPGKYCSRSSENKTALKLFWDKRSAHEGFDFLSNKWKKSIDICHGSREMQLMNSRHPSVIITFRTAIVAKPVWQIVYLSICQRIYSKTGQPMFPAVIAADNIW